MNQAEKPVELQLLIGLNRVLNDIDRQLARVLAKYGLTIGQYGVLEALYVKGDLTVGEVQRKIFSTTGTIPLIIRNLEKRGYIERYTDEKDRRRSMLHLNTPLGQAVIEEALPSSRQFVIEAMSSWSANDKARLLDLLKKYESRQQ